MLIKKGGGNGPVKP